MSQPSLAQDLKSLQTVAESSGFTATSTSRQVEEFIQACTAAEHVSSHVIGQTVQGRDLHCVCITRTPFDPLKKANPPAGKNVVLLLGNIHSGECAGKEALLQLIRELALRPESPWLEKNVLLFVPNYSADSNDQVGLENRPGQVGPEKGMGRRANLQRLDLNRDFMKLESPEARSLVALIDRTDPYVFVDCHTTNGSKHRYQLTYDIPHNPAAPEGVRNFLRSKMMPAITESLKEKGTSTFYYGNFNRQHTAWNTFGYEPRYSTEYVGMRGRLGILSEAYSYISYEERINATHAFVSEVLDYATAQSDTIRELVEASQADIVDKASREPQRVVVPLTAGVEAYDEKFTLLGYKDDQPHDYQCDFFGKYVTKTKTTLPFAWILPVQYPRLVDRMLKHGITVQRLTAESTFPVVRQQVVNLAKADREFQKHKMVTRLEVNQQDATETFAAGTYVVRSAQPLGMLAAMLLEAESPDGFAAWNFLDDVLEKGQFYPIARINEPVQLKSENIDKVNDLLPITLDMIDGPGSLFADRAKTARWFGDTNLLTDQYWGRDVVVDVETNAIINPETAFSGNELVAALSKAKLGEEVAESLGKADPIRATNGKYSVLQAGSHAVVYFHETKDLLVIGTADDKAELPVFSPSENQLAYVNDKGLNFLDLETRQTKTVPKENKDNLVGKLDWVYQEELYGRGNFKGFWWHPSEDRVAFLSLDEAPVLPFTVMDHLPVRGKSEFTNYPKAGDPLPGIKLGVIETKGSSEVKWIELSSWSDELLISAVSWSQSGDRLIAQIQNREQTWLDVFTTAPDGSAPKVVFRDQTSAWIESPGDPVFLADDSFLWVSPRSGYKHLYRYKLDGTMVEQLTDGDWEVRSLVGLDKEKKFCFFTSAKDAPTEMHLYRLNLESKEVKRLTNEAGYHDVSFSNDKSYYLDSFSTFGKRNVTRVHRNDGSEIRKLNASSDDRYQYVEKVQPKFFTIETDGQSIDALLLLPKDFDKTKKWPLMIHIYAGPQAPRVKNRFGGQWGMWHQMLAQQGYPVLIVDNRSASHRSAKGAWPVFRNFASAELADVLHSIEAVKKQGWVDEKRIGLWGWSYGGYMTAFAMTHSDVFKVGISGAPVTDWKNYDAIYTERYMGLPKENPEGYKRSSVLEAADQLSGKLLLIHGTIDDNVHLNNTLQLAQELQFAGKQFELMMYPANRHSVTDEKQLKHLRKLMTDFVLKNL